MMMIIISHNRYLSRTIRWDVSQYLEPDLDFSRTKKVQRPRNSSLLLAASHL